MKIIKIKQEKQENCLWGMPYNCYSIEGDIFIGKNSLLQSALIIAIDETWNRKFKIFFSDSEGFMIQIFTGVYNSFAVTKGYNIYYKNYEIFDDTLYEFDNDQEHKTFLRKRKIEQLENIF